MLGVSSITLALAVLLGWIRATVFSPDECTARATELLDSSVVRATLAETVTDQIVQRGPSSLVSYRSVILVAVEAVVQTDAFKQVFKKALRSAHDAVFAKNGDSVVLNLVDSMSVIRGRWKSPAPTSRSRSPAMWAMCSSI
ncbi:MAG: hypothetical protein N2037_05820 [Acidimicrobiales bacterium]|nr:hypothetical protein [Acidimicrobiales bacterium]